MTPEKTRDVDVSTVIGGRADGWITSVRISRRRNFRRLKERQNLKDKAAGAVSMISNAMRQFDGAAAQ